MKKLNENQLVLVSGGEKPDPKGVVTGACVVVGLASLFTVVATPVAVGCAVFAVVNWLAD